MNRYVISGSCLLLFIILVVLVMVSRHDELPPEEPTPSIINEISFYHYFSGSLSGGLEEMVDIVNSRQTDNIVSAQALDHEAFKSMIHTTLAKGNPPELFSYWAGERVQQLVDQQLLAPLDELWETEKFSNRFPPAINQAACTYNNKKYLLPITQHVVVFFYNKKIFADLGLAPPQTWEEFIALCQAIREGGYTPIALGARERWPAQFWFDYLLLRTAGPEYRRQLLSGNGSFIDPEVERVYKIWAELLQQDSFNADANDLDWAEATDLVQQAKAAMTLMGTWAIQRLDTEQSNSKSETEYDFFAFPTIDDGVVRAALGPIDGIVLSRDSVNHAFAKQVLAYFAEADAQKRMSTGSGALAPNMDIPRSFYSPLKRRLLEEIERADQWAFNFDLATPYTIAEKGMDSFNELIEFPNQYREILQNLHKEIDNLHTNSIQQ